MSEIWVQAIIIQHNKVLFGYGKGHHYFIGKILEQDETPEQVIQQALREVNVDGNILFRIDEPDIKQTWNQSAFLPHITFLIDIGDQTPFLNFDLPLSDKTNQDKALIRIELNPLQRPEAFTEIDIGYFKLLLADCRKRNVIFPWTNAMNDLVHMW